jgi:Tol biopolymer transport system component
VINADGSGDRRIVSAGFPDVVGQPTWSPDGTKIAFRGFNSSEFHAGLWTVKPDGSDPTRVCCGGDGIEGIDVLWPDWSPDGRTILFQNDGGRVSTRGYYRVDADGSGLVKLYPQAPLPSALGEPIWSPDGSRIVFPQSEPGVYGGFSLYATRPDFSDLVRLTGPHPPSGNDTEPDWQPIPAPQRSGFKNSNQFCRAEQAFWGNEFAGRYGSGANAFGKCVSQNH